MQTFLPYPNFKESAKVLDMKRLGKQRVETYQIMKALKGLSKGWGNHPMTRMWKGYESALLRYQMAICEEWTGRGYKDTCLKKTEDAYFSSFDPEQLSSKITPPPWLGREDFHASHRAALLFKKPEYYSQFGWKEEPKQEYVWPVPKNT